MYGSSYTRLASLVSGLNLVLVHLVKIYLDARAKDKSQKEARELYGWWSSLCVWAVWVSNG